MKLQGRNVQLLNNVNSLKSTLLHYKKCLISKLRDSFLTLSWLRGPSCIQRDEKRDSQIGNINSL